MSLCFPRPFLLSIQLPSNLSPYVGRSMSSSVVKLEYKSNYFYCLSIHIFMNIDMSNDTLISLELERTKQLNLPDLRYCKVNIVPMDRRCTSKDYGNRLISLVSMNLFTDYDPESFICSIWTSYGIIVFQPFTSCVCVFICVCFYFYTVYSVSDSHLIVI